MSIRVTINCQVLLRGFIIWQQPDSHWNWVIARVQWQWVWHSMTPWHLLSDPCVSLLWAAGKLPGKIRTLARRALTTLMASGARHQWPSLLLTCLLSSSWYYSFRSFSQILTSHWIWVGDNKRPWARDNWEKQSEIILNGSCLLFSVWFHLDPWWQRRVMTPEGHELRQSQVHSLTLTIYNQTRGKLKGWKSPGLREFYIKVHIFRWRRTGPVTLSPSDTAEQCL